MDLTPVKLNLKKSVAITLLKPNVIYLGHRFGFDL